MQTHKQHFLRKHGLPEDTTLSIKQISYLSGFPVSALEEVAHRGRGAWISSISTVRLKKDYSKNPNISKYPRSERLGQEQWGKARVYSFVDKGKTFYTADADIAKKYNLN